MERSASRKPTAQPIASAVLPDNTYLELIRTPKGSTTLLRWTGEKESCARKISVGSNIFVAADCNSGIPVEMRLASKLDDKLSTATLVKDIVDVLQSFAGLSSTNAYLAAFFAIATHFSDCRSPSLRTTINGRAQWESMQLLRLLTCFCRHALSLTRFNEDYLWQLPPGCTPTFLVADPRPSRTLVAFLNATQHAEFAVPRRGETISHPFSAVILDRQDARGEMPDSFLRIDATQVTQPKLLDRDELREIECKFQPQLLQYRLHHHSQVMGTTFDTRELGGSTRALASVLASSFPDDQALQNQAVEIMRPQDEARRLDCAYGESAVVLDALLTVCHEGKSEVHIGEVTQIANGILDIRGDGYLLKSRRVGGILKSYGLSSRRDTKGYKFMLTRDVKREIHELGKSYGAPFLKGQSHPCEFCKTTSVADAG